MSHFTTIKIQIKDVAALKHACEELELELVPNVEARGWVGNTHKGEYVRNVCTTRRPPLGSSGLRVAEWMRVEG